MAALFKFKADVTGANLKLRALGKGANSRDMLQTLGNRMLRYIDRQFETGGGGRWARNKPNTIVKKRSNITLEDTGQLRRSYKMRIATGYSVTIFPVQQEKAKYAEYGTRPHAITKGPPGYLRFPVVGGMKYTHAVNHPGTPARPILPAADHAKLITELAVMVQKRMLVGTGGK
jgi:hypothetical protein